MKNFTHKLSLAPSPQAAIPSDLARSTGNVVWNPLTPASSRFVVKSFAEAFALASFGTQDGDPFTIHLVARQDGGPPHGYAIPPGDYDCKKLIRFEVWQDAPEKNVPMAFLAGARLIDAVWGEEIVTLAGVDKKTAETLEKPPISME